MKFQQNRPRMSRNAWEVLMKKPMLFSRRFLHSNFNRRKDYYKILDVQRTAKEKEIKDAYYQLVKIYHPDVNKRKEDSEKFKEIDEAYKVLRDSKSRKEYDHLWVLRATTSGTGGGGMGSETRQTDFNEQKFRAGRSTEQQTFGGGGMGSEARQTYMNKQKLRPNSRSAEQNFRDPNFDPFPLMNTKEYLIFIIVIILFFPLCVYIYRPIFNFHQRLLENLLPGEFKKSRSNENVVKEKLIEITFDQFMQLQGYSPSAGQYIAKIDPYPEQNLLVVFLRKSATINGKRLTAPYLHVRLPESIRMRSIVFDQFLQDYLPSIKIIYFIHNRERNLLVALLRPTDALINGEPFNGPVLIVQLPESFRKVSTKEIEQRIQEEKYSIGLRK